MNFEAHNQYNYPPLSFGGKIRPHSRYEFRHTRKQVSHDNKKKVNYFKRPLRLIPGKVYARSLETARF
jgi:hypothetical protein